MLCQALCQALPGSKLFSKVISKGHSQTKGLIIKVDLAFWVLTVCKAIQQTTKMAKSRERVNTLLQIQRKHKGRSRGGYGVQSPIPWKITSATGITIRTPLDLLPLEKLVPPPPKLENFSFPWNKQLDPLCKLVEAKKSKKTSVFFVSWT